MKAERKLDFSNSLIGSRVSRAITHAHNARAESLGHKELTDRSNIRQVSPRAPLPIEEETGILRYTRIPVRENSYIK